MDNSQIEDLVDQIAQRVIELLEEKTDASVKAEEKRNSQSKKQFKVIGGSVPAALLDHIEHNDSADGILITNLTVYQLLRLSQLVALDKDEEQIIAALLNNNLVIALNVNQFEVENRYLKSKLQEAKKRLSAYGMNFSHQNQLIGELSNLENKKSSEKEKEQAINRSNHFLTVKEVEARLTGNPWLYLEENEYLTPMAKDFLRDRNIEVY